MSADWYEKPFDEAEVTRIEAAGIPRLVARLLAIRGVSAADLEEYFHPRLDALANPGELPGIERAADEILAAVRAKVKIVVFGDYDCDGVCATAILVKALGTLGADVSPFLPERLTEGYGMSESSVSRMLKENPEVRLVVTVDNGINSVEETAALAAKGISVVVTDHHLPGSELPACTVVNPKVSAPPKLDGLCGAGVAFLLANELVAKARAAGVYGGPKIGGELLVLAGLATVTDIMPLKGHNRVLVSEALRRFRTLAPIGLKELFDRASRSGVTALTAKDFGFMLGPRINASGRLASGMEALELVLADDREIARECARIVDSRNGERRLVEQRMTDEALSKVVTGAAAQVIELPCGHPGVAGIVAARVLERLDPQVPVCVVVDGHGSARSPGGINIRSAMEDCHSLLERFGGHAAACGFSVKPGKIDEFRARLCACCADKMTERAGVAVDAFVRARDLTVETVDATSEMEPFGEGNPEPVFAMKGVFLKDVRPLGQDGRHLALSVEGLRCVFWNHGDRVEELRGTSAAPRDILFTVGMSDYGERHVELRLIAIK